MANVFSSRSILLLALLMAGCTMTRIVSSSPETDGPEASPEAGPVAASQQPQSSPSTPPAQPPTAQPAAPEPPTTYADAIARASTAFSLSQSARSKDDWRLVASRWQQAIALLEGIPDSSPDFATVPQKLAEYRQNLAYAQEQADVPIPEVASGGVVVVPAGEADATEPDAAEPDATVLSRPRSPLNPSGSSPTSRSSASGQSPRVYEAPIVRRAGGTPVILVIFNGNEPFEMIVDTGASGTVITQPMARALNVEAVGEARVATASANNVPFQLGYVSSLEVAGARVDEVLVAIAGPELSTGLLGQDFFSDFDVTVRESVVEFRER